MQKYFDFAFLIDLFFAFIVGGIIIFLHLPCSPYIILPKVDTLNDFLVSLIAISGTLLGFLLTILTIIVTFKNGFEPKNESENLIPNFTIFDKKIDKKSKFYNSDIYRGVVEVFFSATKEILFLILFLMIVQFNLNILTTLYISTFVFCGTLILFLALLRSFYIFKLFLDVHS